MHALYNMKSNFDKIFSDNLETIKEKNLIDLDRLYNILSVLRDQQAQLDKDINDINSSGVINQKDINQMYVSELKAFLIDLNDLFTNTPFIWENTQE